MWCATEVCSLLRCVGVTSPRHVIGSCTMMQIVVTKTLSRARLQAPDKSAAKDVNVGDPPQLYHRGSYWKWMGNAAFSLQRQIWKECTFNPLSPFAPTTFPNTFSRVFTFRWRVSRYVLRWRGRVKRKSKLALQTKIFQGHTSNRAPLN